MDGIGHASFLALGTGAVVLTADQAGLGDACLAVASEIDAIDRACSRFRDDSELARVNSSGGEPVAVGPVLLDALEAALCAARLTDGDVDPTVGEAIRVLGYDRDFAAVPRTGGPLLQVAKVPGWRQVALDRERGLVRVPGGVRLDLGATAKALAADPTPIGGDLVPHARRAVSACPVLALRLEAARAGAGR